MYLNHLICLEKNKEKHKQQSKEWYQNNKEYIKEIGNSNKNKVKVDLDNQQREYFLNQQMKTIQEELGGNSNDQEISGLIKKAGKKCMKTMKLIL